jgi:hypothetical protein
LEELLLSTGPAEPDLESELLSKLELSVSQSFSLLKPRSLARLGS